MKKLFAFIVLVAVVAGGYSWLRKHGQLDLTFLEGERVVVTRGDLEVPITASGRIEPASITKIKGEASGTVQFTPQRVGEMVSEGELIIALDPEDEQRNVDRTTADYERARIAYERALLNKEEAEKVGLLMAEAEKEQAEARLAYIEIEHTQKHAGAARSRAVDLDAHTQQELATVDARLKEAKAALKAAQAKVGQAQMALRYAEKDVAASQQNETVAGKTLDDAKERLRKTKVCSPIDGMILKRYVELGEVVQSGTTSLTGGTILVDLADVSEIYAVVNVDEADIGMVRELAPPEAVPGSSSQPEAVLAGYGSDAGEDQTDNPDGEPKVEIEPGAISEFQEVEVTVESFTDERFYGIIERIAPQSELSQAIATFKVWIRLTSPNKVKLIGLLNVQAEAHFTAKSVRDALLVSYDAFQREGDDFGVYVPIKNPQPGEPKYEFRPCVFGRDNGIMVEVRSGLEEGDEVFVELPAQTRKEAREAEEDDD